MKEKTFEELLTRKATKSELKELIKLANNEIKEWESFIKLCENKLTNLK